MCPKEVLAVLIYLQLSNVPNNAHFTLEFVILLQVLTETDHCYCVLLNAHGGAAFPSEKEQHDCNSSNTSSLSTGSDSEKTKNTKVRIISFFHY